MQRCHQALATQKTTPESLWSVFGDSSMGIRSDINLYFICCFSKLKMITHATTVSPVSETVMFRPACPGRQTHPSTRTLPHRPQKIPAVRVYPFSEDSHAVRKNCTQQELHFYLPEILPFGRTRFFFLFPFSLSATNFKIYGMFPYKIF